MRYYMEKGWEKIFHALGLNDFDALWNLAATPIDVPNFGRGKKGESSVGIVQLTAPDGRNHRLVFKRQINYFSRTFFHPFRGIPTSKKELLNLLKLNSMGVSCCKPVYYAERQSEEGLKAILITEFLEGFVPLEAIIEERPASLWGNLEKRKRLITAVATAIGRIHDLGFQYNCLYVKHIFVREEGDDITVSFIDLEKGDWPPFSSKRRQRDLSTLNRRTKGLTNGDRCRFLLAYLGVPRLDRRAKALCRSVSMYDRKKNRD